VGAESLTLNAVDTSGNAVLDISRLTVIPRIFSFPDISGSLIVGTSTVGSLAKWSDLNTLESATAGTDYQLPYWIQSGSNLYASSTSWNVGIGTTAPDSKLHISEADGTNALKIGLTTFPTTAYLALTTNSLILQRRDTSIVGLTIKTQVESGSFGATGGYIAFSPNNAEAMRILTSGKVGIGTTAPSTPLHVIGSSTISNGNIRISSSTYGLVFPDTSIQLSGYKLLAGASIIAPSSTINTAVVIGRPFVTSTAIETWCTTTGSNTVVNFQDDGIAFATTTATQAGNTSSSLSQVITNKKNITIKVVSTVAYDTTSTLSCAVYGTQ
jgi:hypothetical protein